TKRWFWRKAAPPRRAYVPVPPASPVVWVSRKRSPRGSDGASRGASNSSAGTATASASPRASRPWRCESGYSRRTTTSGPPPVSTTSPPTRRSIGSWTGRVARPVSMRRVTRRSSSSGRERPFRAAGELTEEGSGGGLGSSAHLVHGPHARGASEAAGASPERVPAALEQQREDIEHPLGETDAAGVAVVEVDRRVEALGL